MEYTAVIRTLGRAGNKYQTLLDSLMRQTIPPAEIIVYLAEGCPIPKETVRKEHYVYVRKGMVAQRALRYEEVGTEYMLFLDDDVYLPETAVSDLTETMDRYGADVISPDVFPNAERPFGSRILMALSGRMVSRRDDKKWGYKVMRTAGYSYNGSPSQSVYLSMTNAGACFFCRKSAFLSIRFEEELWLDRMPYALGDDQVMYYKMFLMGYKQLTLFNSGIRHLDAASTLGSVEKEKRLIGCDFRFKVIFWHRFIYLQEKSFPGKIWSAVCISYALIFTLLVSGLKFRFDILKVKWDAISSAVSFLRSDEYKRIPYVVAVEDKAVCL